MKAKAGPTWRQTWRYSSAAEGEVSGMPLVDKIWHFPHQSLDSLQILPLFSSHLLLSFSLFLKASNPWDPNRIYCSRSLLHSQSTLGLILPLSVPFFSQGHFNEKSITKKTYERMYSHQHLKKLLVTRPILVQFDMIKSIPASSVIVCLV